MSAPVTMKGHDLLSYAEAAAYLGPTVTARWVKRQVLEYGLPAVRLNGRTFVRRADLDALVAKGRTVEGAQ